MLKYGCQNISTEDIEAVVASLSSELLTQGPSTIEFEDKFAKYVDANYAVSVNSATSALHLAYLALGLCPGDRLWTSPNTFVATSNAAIMCGAKVDFVDVDPNNGNICVEALEIKLKLAKQLNIIPKILVPVHFTGLPCDMKRIAQLSEEYGFRVVEDASHAAGARYSDNDDEALVGNCKYSDATVFSFHPVKIFTTGEGGMVTTNNDEVARKVRLLRSHGVTRDPAEMSTDKHGEWQYDQIALGYNYRMTDIQAALGISQLSKLASFLQKRKSLAGLYDLHLANNAHIQVPNIKDCMHSAWHLYVIKVAPERRKEIYDILIKAKIGANVHYKPVHTNSYYRDLGFKLGDYPASEKLYNTMITLPLHTKMEIEDVKHVCRTLNDAVNAK